MDWAAGAGDKTVGELANWRVGEIHQFTNSPIVTVVV
jgi:hypothetical protein